MNLYNYNILAKLKISCISTIFIPLKHQMFNFSNQLFLFNISDKKKMN